jgi:hypothetical protein
MKNKIKPRNPFVVLAKFRKAGSHHKPTKSPRRQEKQILVKTIKQLPESWQKCLSLKDTSAMTSDYLGVEDFSHSIYQLTERSILTRSSLTLGVVSRAN